MNRPRARRPQSAAVLILLRVDGAAVLDDAVTRPDVVQQEVGERVDDLVAQRVGDPERAAVDQGPRSRGDDRRRVAHGAADRR